jgi:ZIP family zinc transporter
MPTGAIVILGAFAGLTIYLGLPIAFLKRLPPASKTFLSMVATGVLIFLLYDMISKASEPIGAALDRVREQHTGQAVFFTDVFLLVLGLGLGLVGLVYFNSHVITRFNRLKPTRTSDPTPGRVAARIAAPDPAPVAQPQLALAAVAASAHPAVQAAQPVAQPVPQAHPAPVAARERELTPLALAFIIATGIGLHNFSEGLAIGQSAAAGALQLAAVLIIGFGLHNMSEGFGIAGPLAGQTISWRLVGLLGLIGGGPTFLGTLVGIAFHSPELFIFCLALAAGAIIYVIAELLGVAKRFKAQHIVMWGLLLGFLLGYMTDLIVTFAGA